MQLAKPHKCRRASVHMTCDDRTTPSSTCPAHDCVRNNNRRGRQQEANHTKSHAPEAQSSLSQRNQACVRHRYTCKSINGQNEKHSFGLQRHQLRFHLLVALASATEQSVRRQTAHGAQACCLQQTQTSVSPPQPPQILLEGPGQQC